MKILFLTNMPAYHQIELAGQLHALLGEGNFYMSVLAPLSDQRKQMRWVDDYQQSYLLRFSEQERDREKTLEWIASADVVIQGRFPIKYLRQRINQGGLTFAYQERLWKKPKSLVRLLSRAVHLYKNYFSVNRSNYHFLSAGHFAAQDLLELGLFRGRAWKFGYFIDSLSLPDKSPGCIKLVWCGRLMALKQPHIALEAAAKLRGANIEFELTMIGDGELLPEMKDRCSELGLDANVRFTSWLTIDQVNAEFAKADVFMMTSNFREGWGLVVNEAINNGCFPIINEAVGSAHSLVQHQQTGIVYSDNEREQMFAQLVALCSDPEQLSLQATIGHRHLTEVWSSNAAAERLVSLSDALLNDQAAADLFQTGPCSSA